MFFNKASNSRVYRKVLQSFFFFSPSCKKRPRIKSERTVQKVILCDFPLSRSYISGDTNFCIRYIHITSIEVEIQRGDKTQLPVLILNKLSTNKLIGFCSILIRLKSFIKTNLSYNTNQFKMKTSEGWSVHNILMSRYPFTPCWYPFTQRYTILFNRLLSLYIYIYIIISLSLSFFNHLSLFFHYYI